MTETTERWSVGDATVTAVVESETHGIPPELFFPDADETLVRQHRWLVPRWADEEGRIAMRVQAFVVQVADRTVVVDPCVGNGRQRSLPWFADLATPFLERLVTAGVDPADVDTVVHTHLHVDHIGWGTHRVDDRWVPTFPNARYLYVEPDLTWLRSRSDDEDAKRIDEDSIMPIFDAGLADVVTDDTELGDGLRLAPTPGHTPGHASVWIERGTAVGLITGDAIHHPVQCAAPAVRFVADDDGEQASKTRHALLASGLERGALVFGTHFPTSPAGQIVDDGEAWRFEAVDGEPVG